MDRFPSASALIGAAEAGSARHWPAPACRGPGRPVVPRTTFPVTSPTPTRRTARCSCWARCMARASAISTWPRSPRSRTRRRSPAPHLHFMHPVKSRTAIRRAFAEFGVRSFALDSEDELKKIAEETGGCRDLTLWVRVAVPAKQQQDPARAQVRRRRRQGRAPAGEGAAGRQGARHHLPCRLADRRRPRPYVTALAEVGKLIAKAGVVLDRLDVGGGFPSIYDENRPAPLSAFVRAIADGVEKLPDRRALPADVRAGPRPGGGGGVADRARRRAARQRAVHQRRQLRHAVRCGAHGLQLPGAPGRPAGRRRASRWCRSRSGARPATPSTSCRARSCCRPRSGKATTSRSATPAPTAAPSPAASTATAPSTRRSCSMSRC